jgi:anion-transporting  ArsA/GET3 family ATPase
MASLLERRLLIVTGKGGTGKTTVACALGLAGAARGARTIVAELGGQRRLPELFAPSAGLPRIGEETQLDDRLWSVSIDPDEAMIDWLRALTGRVSARMLASSSTFRYFAAAAPGAKELITMVKLLNLVERYELVVLDASATGHALAMLRSPQTFMAIARVGPLANQARRVRRLLEDRERCACVAVAHASEMAVAETLELEEQLRRLLDRHLDAVFVNGMLPRRFSREELAALEGLEDSDAVVHAAVLMARTISGRSRLQQSQIARLRRQRFANGAPSGVLTLPFAFAAVDLEWIRQTATVVARKV